jgi:CheY-like chemotaxis protein
MPGILIVEDDMEMREMLKISLIRRKYTVIEAGNGKEAIARFKPSVTDMVITDLIMPEDDGLKVIMRLRELKPSIGIIAISGGGKAGPGNYLSLAKALGADAIFSKPFSVNDLIATIEKMLETKQNAG